MSLAELERFQKDLRSNEAMLAEARKGEKQIAHAVDVGARHGYSFTADELKAFLEKQARARGKALTDKQLDSLSGGGIPGPCSPLFVDCRTNG